LGQGGSDLPPEGGLMAIVFDSFHIRNQKDCVVRFFGPSEEHGLYTISIGDISQIDIVGELEELHQIVTMAEIAIEKEWKRRRENEQRRNGKI